MDFTARADRDHGQLWRGVQAGLRFGRRRVYLSQGEEFLTDEEYLSYAFEQAGFSESEELEMDARRR